MGSGLGVQYPKESGCASGLPKSSEGTWNGHYGSLSPEGASMTLLGLARALWLSIPLNGLHCRPSLLIFYAQLCHLVCLPHISFCLHSWKWHLCHGNGGLFSELAHATQLIPVGPPSVPGMVQMATLLCTLGETTPGPLKLL